jgi:hypothetical protein
MPDATAPTEGELARKAFREQGRDPHRVRQSLIDATNLARGRWFTFLTLGTYLAITVAGVTHADLFSRKAGQAAASQCRSAARPVLLDRAHPLSDRPRLGALEFQSCWRAFISILIVCL